MQVKGTIDTTGVIGCGPRWRRLVLPAPRGYVRVHREGSARRQTRPLASWRPGGGGGGGPGVVQGGLRGGEGDQPGTRGVVEDPFDGVFGVGNRTRFEPQIRHVSGVDGISPDLERYFVVQLAHRARRDAVGAGGLGFDGVGDRRGWPHGRGPPGLADRLVNRALGNGRVRRTRGAMLVGHRLTSHGTKVAGTGWWHRKRPGLGR